MFHRRSDPQEQLAAALAPQQRVAVLGNSHSAAVALAKLGEPRRRQGTAGTM